MFEWKHDVIKISVPGGYNPKEAEVYGPVAIFFETADRDMEVATIQVTGWSVTHILTGRRFGGLLESKEEAKRLAESLAGIVGIDKMTVETAKDFQAQILGAFQVCGIEYKRG